MCRKKVQYISFPLVIWGESHLKITLIVCHQVVPTCEVSEDVVCVSLPVPALFFIYLLLLVWPSAFTEKFDCDIALFTPFINLVHFMYDDLSQIIAGDLRLCCLLWCVSLPVFLYLWKISISHCNVVMSLTTPHFNGTGNSSCKGYENSEWGWKTLKIKAAWTSRGSWGPK